MTGIYLLLGSNLGDRRANLKMAQKLLQSEVGAFPKTSSLYRTKAWGPILQAAYYNQVLEVNTQLEPHALLKRILSVEKKMGRVRKKKWGPRTIDIDILYYNREIIKDSNLILPHPQIPYRRFALVPLCEVAPDFQHPALGKTNQELLDLCQDDLAVRRLASKP